MNDVDIEKKMREFQVPGLSFSTVRNAMIQETVVKGVLEAGTDRNVNESSLFNACSMSKWTAAMLVLKLVGEGTLSLDEEVNYYLQGDDHEDYSPITLRSLLSHQAGFIDPPKSFGEYESRYGRPAIDDLLAGKTVYCQEQIYPKVSPGEKFIYTDAGFCFLQYMIEKITGESFETVVEQKIFTPLQMNHSQITSSPEQCTDKMACGHDSSGKRLEEKFSIYPYPAAAGLWSSSDDLAKLLVEVMKAVSGKGKLGIPQESAKEMVTSQGCSEWTGLGVFIDPSGDLLEISSLGWGAGYQSLMAAYPFAGRGAIVMTNADLGVHQLEGLIGEILPHIL
ncbi:beta-lactamase family protein [Halobacillus salinarum]|uniref:Beta-lactamase family protein n=1 Tax=Halobacillus salinarum TaxID=2932257 RepID=A0ABY4EJC4_9BACI|nr:serine hydrolase domain-containing protein [Halobacillus salinarum]UOQ44535.1 beta-lactamase family protein [Halobacillus salinarum]